MKMKEQFYYCPHCGNIVLMVVSAGVIPVCCGEEMHLLTPHTQEEGKEKHLPVVECYDKHKLKVTVGSEAHPMVPEHHISFVALVTTAGILLHRLLPPEAPETKFRYRGTPLAVLSYCNVHGLWMTPVEECCKK